jgi:ribosomal protein S18 acetylase RimI-like enzyme
MTTTLALCDMRAEDFNEIFALWQRCDGVGLTPSDCREAVEAYLIRNPGLSLVARRDSRIIGAVLCGHDGRRGYLYHLAVDREHRQQGVGKSIVNECLARLTAARILKVTIFVYDRNRQGQAFWRKAGWKDRGDLVVLQMETGAAT